MAKPVDVLVVGAGVIGLALAWRAAQAGMSVRVVERDIPGAGATSVAAGILSPVIFGDWKGADDAFNLRAVAGWNLFADELSAAAGTCLPYSRTGALYIGERAQFENVRGGQRLDEKECRELEPGLAAGAVGMFMAAEAAVDTEMLVLTLLQACTHAGVLVSAHTHATAMLCDESGRCLGLAFADERQLAQTTVLACGSWSGTVAWLPPALRPPVTPLLGEMLLLQGDARAPVCSHIIRSPTGSLVPRTRARYWVGTTTREAGFDANVTVASIMDILANHVRLLPALAATSLVYARAGLRPRTSDNKPVVGWVRPGLLYATGHGSKGILYAAFFNLGQS